VPSPGEWPAGCRFATRCHRVLEICPRVFPDATRLSESHEVWCHAVARDEGRA
jgi:peptide/nickel transport system ATP-binding protein